MAQSYRKISATVLSMTRGAGGAFRHGFTIAVECLFLRSVVCCGFALGVCSGGVGGGLCGSWGRG